MAIIQKTTDYGQFKTKKGNRPVIKGSVNRLIRSIREQNMLSANPIIVNKDMDVIDGQHRLAAAAYLKTPIYYVVFDPASLHEIQLLNANVKAWTVKDFMDSYIATGREDYKRFKEFWEKWGFTFSASLTILGTKTLTPRTGLHQLFKEGKFKIVDLKRAEDLADKLQLLLKNAHPNVRGSVRFYDAYFRMYNNNPEIISELIDKSAGRMRIYRLDKTSEYIRLFEDIINEGRYGKPIRLY